MGSLKKPNLPVIEFSVKHLDTASSSWVTKRVEVTRALEEYGCFIATYDGVSQELHDAIFLASQELFDLPTEVKVLNTSDTPSHGYVGQIPVIPLYEGLGIEDATTTHGVERFTKLMWPSGKDSFSESVLKYTKAVAELDQIVMRMVATNYGIEEHYESLLGSTTYLLKLIKYISPQGDDRNMGIVPHTDKTFMSILHQNEVKGLEIKTKDGEWIEVHPSPSSFIVMAGDACMAWTNGRIEPSCHRVMMQGNTDRYSLGLFTFIRDLKVEAPQELVDENHPLQFKAFDHYKYLHYHASAEGRRSKFPLKSYCGI
ncbi:putative oxoglutarate/iron-dependent dioxygenase, non-heme dioxygenase domain-containing protein [Helianthus annuus]|nr:putative oxoglutarate/iron-dependent dioxygenase, non-heme dioxygenase domain-containing protein [Helianthus annuus]KAJ0536943.1 putative oxoglutarate/iron-dependent dioxygenase, non-heme dioxygenase domain-containing protein [Helianthus annuus]KAJ0895497.1 putative oxoglutarate/iron-dependent dioxygenase, non-heme dioxygenase domain-containing protein [Helianthus annuus]